MIQFTHGSLFSGSGGFDEGARRNDITSLWCSEIEPFPIRVLRKNFPNAKQLGDVSMVEGDKIAPVDVISGGSPCQDMSVAGKRAGLSGSRSVLFYEQIRIVREMREKTNGRYPRFMVWENVPGAFSSNKGEDFGAVLEETAKVAEGDACIPGPPNGKWPHAGCIMGDGWSIAWRLFDAQYWGVPQRRQRIYLVADFRGESAPEILFEREGVSRDIEPSGKEGEGAAGDAERGIGKTSEPILLESNQNHATIQTNGISTALPASAGMGGGYVPMICLNDQGGSVMSVSENVVGTLRAQEHGHTPLVFEPGAASRVGGHIYKDGIAGALRAHAGDNQQAVVYGISAYESNAMKKSSNSNSGIYQAETARTLDLSGGSPACNQGGTAVVCLEGNGSRPSHQGDGWHEGDPMYTLNGTEHHAVVYRGDAITGPVNASNPRPGGPCHTLTNDGRNHVVLENHPADSCVKISEDGMVQTSSSKVGTGGGNVPMVIDGINGEIAGTLDCGIAKGTNNQLTNSNMLVTNTSVVRRLTPLECARLQGFPDWWCDDLITTSDDDVRFFLDVWFRYWTITRGSKNPKTENQVKKWLANEPSDSDVYKMWGNGVALPNVEYIFSGIRRILEND